MKGPKVSPKTELNTSSRWGRGEKWGGGGMEKGGWRWEHKVSLFEVLFFTPTNLIHVLHIAIFKHPLRRAVVDIAATKLGILLYHLLIFRKWKLNDLQLKFVWNGRQAVLDKSERKPSCDEATAQVLKRRHFVTWLRIYLWKRFAVVAFCSSTGTSENEAGTILAAAIVVIIIRIFEVMIVTVIVHVIVRTEVIRRVWKVVVVVRPHYCPLNFLYPIHYWTFIQGVRRGISPSGAQRSPVPRKGSYGVLVTWYSKKQFFT